VDRKSDRKKNTHNPYVWSDRKKKHTIRG